MEAEKKAEEEKKAKKAEPTPNGATVVAGDDNATPDEVSKVCVVSDIGGGVLVDCCSCDMHVGMLRQGSCNCKKQPYW